MLVYISLLFLLSSLGVSFPLSLPESNHCSQQKTQNISSPSFPSIFFCQRKQKTAYDIFFCCPSERSHKQRDPVCLFHWEWKDWKLRCISFLFFFTLLTPQRIHPHLSIFFSSIYMSVCCALWGIFSTPFCVLSHHLLSFYWSVSKMKVITHKHTQTVRGSQKRRGLTFCFMGWFCSATHELGNDWAGPVVWVKETRWRPWENILLF